MTESVTGDRKRLVSSSEESTLTRLINNKIERLRPKLLDFTKRNPLLSTSFSDRLRSHVRIVDEVLELLFDSLTSKTMRIVPLPPLEAEPKDELSREFQDALSEAQINDETYLQQLETIQPDDEQAPDIRAKANRDLKDRIRARLNMPARPSSKDHTSIRQHAVMHHVHPDYDLSPENRKYDDDRYTNRDIQTLMLPDDLERQLNALYDKANSWKQESGINVLHAAVGFLEWKSPNESKPSYSPLVLLPIELEKKQSKSGAEFYVTSNEETAAGNLTLAEKLRVDFNIILPEYRPGEPLGEYLKQIAEQKPKGLDWRVHYWSVIGIFPSARLAMYYDLAPETGWDFATHPILSKLFGGSQESAYTSPFGDEYNIDDPTIESKVPLIISDIDSSQFSAIADVIDGKNLVVKGPPGTGKSQTIVNTIAATLAAGKKVLFLAEKMAALEVVRSRLAALGLGEFILPLQATRSARNQVAESIRARIEMPTCSDPAHLKENIARFREIRQELQLYIELSTSIFEDTGLTVYQIIGRSIALRKIADLLPVKLKNYNLSETKKMPDSEDKKVRALLEEVKNIWVDTTLLPDCWKGIRINNLDPFKAEQILQAAQAVHNSCSTLISAREKLKTFALSPKILLAEISSIINLLDNLPKQLAPHNVRLADKLVLEEGVALTEKFLETLTFLRNERDVIEQEVGDVFNLEAAEILAKAAELAKRYDIHDISPAGLDRAHEEHSASLKALKQTYTLMDEASRVAPCFARLPAQVIVNTCDLVAQTSREALMVRHKSLLDPQVQALIQKANPLIERLRDQRQKLAEKLKLDSLPDKRVILTHLGNLIEAGFLRWGSPKYWKARKFYLHLSKTPHFDRKDAITTLEQLHAWLEDQEELHSYEKLKKVLGANYDGAATNLVPYLELIHYFATIDLQLAGMETAELRALLRSGEIDVLLALPKIGEDHPIRLFSSAKLDLIAKQVAEAEQTVRELDLALDHIRKALPLLKGRSHYSSEELEKLVIRLKSWLSQSGTIAEDKKVKEILGEGFQGLSTSLDNVTQVLGLAKLLVGLRKDVVKSLIHAIETNQTRALNSELKQILDCDLQARSALEELAHSTNTASSLWSKDKSYQELATRMQQAAHDKQGLIAYSRMAGAVEEVHKAGLGDFIEEILANYKEPCEIFQLYEAMMAQMRARMVYAKHGAVLSKFNGIKLNSLRSELARVDRQIIELSRQHLQSMLYNNSSPPPGKGHGPKSTFTEMALLKNEISKKQRFIPIRDTVTRASESLLEIKPCWMMSPLAVSQYIPKDTAKFDLVIIDEASQMAPENAIGALLRANQVMVVGDENQLPPTAFFTKLLAGDGLVDGNDEDGDGVVLEESILDVAKAVFAPPRKLRWHYRSRHSGLIAFSNRYIYDNNLIVFPAPDEGNGRTGVFYHYVENGLYKASTNPVEARKVVDAALEFMATYPEWSLGIVTLNQTQQELLREEMEHAFARNPKALKYKERWAKERDGLEYFFIKNLENVQGDERDVIFISTVYGPEQPVGKVMQRFGPINGLAGKRRLNVLFSRAKQRIVTFSSMRTGDIDAKAEGNAGAYMLKRWLEYSANGTLDGGKATNSEPDSEFEIHVMEQIKAMGCEVVPQVGVSGYFIDIGVRHPSWPNGFIMGVECDGASYHSSKSARDRDRLRQAVLEGLGWHLYRIWSTDWFTDSVQEVDKLRKVIEDRVNALIKRTKR
ncbi:MAG: DUF4011 domain-containing protein [Proteobacteria bacterium]|nr:DUF4011 domain-containing protein [Pseudomonadota bacterium]